MKFVTKKQALENALVKIETIVPARDTQTILANILVRISANEVCFTASDMESTAQVTIEANDTVKGEIIVKAKKILEIAKKINATDVVFEVAAKEKEAQDEEESYQITISGANSGSARFKMTGNSAKNFPKVNSISQNKLSSVSTAVFAEMIHKTFYAISQDDNRYVYNGLFVDFDGSFLTLVGTDGRRLSAIKRALPHPIHIEKSEGADIVIHAKAIRELQRLFSDADEIYLGKEMKDIFFKIGNAELSSRLLDGKYPDYKKVIPSTSSSSMIINRENLLDALKQVMVMTEQPSFQVRMNLSEKNILLSANTPDLGEAEISLGAEFKGEGLEIGFNSTYLNDILRSLTCINVKLEFLDSSKPLVVRDTEDENFVSLIMPMRI